MPHLRLVLSSACPSRGASAPQPYTYPAGIQVKRVDPATAAPASSPSPAILPSSRNCPTNTDTSGSLPSSSAAPLSPNDVLCGRGERIQDYVGNVTFRAIVADRIPEYFERGNNNNETKNRIAGEVVNYVRSDARGARGRFLALVATAPSTGNDGGGAAAQFVVRGQQGPGGEIELWTEVDDKTALEKVKQTFRNQNKQLQQEQERQEQQQQRGVGVGANGNGATPRSGSVGGLTVGVRTSTDGLPSSSSSSLVGDDKRLGGLLSSPHNDSVREGGEGASEGSAAALQPLYASQTRQPSMAAAAGAASSSSSSSLAMNGGHCGGGDSSSHHDVGTPFLLAANLTNGDRAGATSILTLGAAPTSNPNALELMHPTPMPFAADSNPQALLSVIALPYGGGASATSALPSSENVDGMVSFSDEMQIYASLASVDVDARPGGDVQTIDAPGLGGGSATSFGSNHVVGVPNVHAVHAIPTDAPPPAAACISGAFNTGADTAPTMMAAGVLPQDVAPQLVGPADSVGGHRQRKDNLLESITLALQLTGEIRRSHEESNNKDDDGRHGSDDGSGERSGVNDDRIGNDLVTLGRFLYGHFAGVEPPSVVDGDDDDGEPLGGEAGSIKSDATEALDLVAEDSSGATLDQVARRVSKKARGRPTTTVGDGRRGSRPYVVPLQDFGLPVSLGTVISSLMDAKDACSADRYTSAEQVEHDLLLMSTDPDRFLFDKADAEEQESGELDFPKGRLYGREGQISTMMAVFDRVIGGGSCDDACEVVLVHGYSGTGKSALVEHIRQPLVERGGDFVAGKFVELGPGHVQPMSVIFSAFNEYCNDLYNGDATKLAQVGEAINKALGSHSNVLTDLIPSLRNVLRISSPRPAPIQVGGKEALNRLSFYLRVFARAIASPSHPVVFFLDDLQWADKASLEVWSMLVSDTELSSVLFIGCYRDNEVGMDHPINEEMGNVVLAGVKISNIKLTDVDLESVNALISDTLRLSPRLTPSLANVVYAKTSGNPLFAVQFLRSLWDENLLLYSARSRRWEWDVDAIQAKDIADNVVDLMTGKMRKLSPGAIWLLKLAACLGSRCEETALLRIMNTRSNTNQSANVPFLDEVIREGLMLRMGSLYKFAHDRIQQAAYALIPECERDALHLNIGRLLWKRTSDDDLNAVIFVVADQLYRGSALISDHTEKVEVARLCLEAGEKAMFSSSFLPASVYLLQGCSLLEESDWEHHYLLSLKLLTCCSEAQYVTGNHDGATITLTPVLTHARCLQDKLHVDYTLLNVLGSQGKHREALKHGLDVLAQLGESFPSEPSKHDAISDLAKTRAMLDGTSIGAVLAQDEMHDPDKLAVMKFLTILSRYSHITNQTLSVLISLRAAQLSLRDGACRESSFAFATLGSVLCSFGKFEEGHRYGKLALSLLERFKAKEFMARVYIVVYGMINIFIEPMQSSLPSLRRGMEIGMSMGDIEWALTNCNIYAVLSIQCANKLEPLAKQVRADVQVMQRHKSHLVIVTLPFLQAILNLTGCSADDPTDLTGDAMNQDELLNSAREKQQLNVAHMICFLRMWLAYLFRRYDIGAEMMNQCRNMRKMRSMSSVVVVNETFYTGLTAAAMFRGGEVGEWRSIALESVEKMKGWAENSAWNYQHKVDLLNAEIAYLNGDIDEAASAYDEAIRVAGEHGFVHEQALACEKAGEFYSSTVSWAMARDYFDRSHKYYLEWGAKGKADDLLRRRIGNAAT